MARGQYQYTAQISGSAYAQAMDSDGTYGSGTSSIDFDSGLVSDTILSDSRENTIKSGTYTGYSFSSASVTPGVIRMRFGGTAGSSILDARGSARGNATAYATSQDYITITSGSLPDGANVSAILTSYVHYDRTVGTAEGDSAQIQYHMSFAHSGGGYTFSHSVNDVTSASLPSGTYTKTETATLEVGATYVMNQVLYGNTSANAGIPYPNVSGPNQSWIDASNTSAFTISFETPDVGLSAVSGGSYAAVPEPASLGMMGLSALAMLGRRRT